MKKFLALLIAAMLLLSSVAALADNEPNLFEIPVTKSIYFYNSEGGNIYEPNITFSYSVAAATEAQINGATITDANNKTVTVKPGKTEALTAQGAVATGTAVFASTNAKVAVDAAKGGKSSKQFTLKLNLDAFKTTDGKIEAGVYRYIITEADIDVTAKGLTARGTDYNKTRLLDVYVRVDANTGEPTGGAVIIDDGDPGEVVTPADEPNKTTGFGDDPDDPTGTDPTGSDPTGGSTTGTPDYSGNANNELVDRYTTYNVTVTNTITGPMGDMTNEFPVTVDIANSIGDAKFDYIVDNDDTTTTSLTADTNKEATVTVPLATGGTYTIVGIPSTQGTTPTVTAAVKEQNNLNETYNIGATKTDLGGSEEEYIAAADVVKDGYAAGQPVSIVPNPSFAFTTTLEDISQTGVVLRFAPYIAMLVAGVALIVILAAKRRKEDEEA